MAFEAFVSCPLGDSLGKTNELRSISNQLAGKGDKLRACWTDIQQRIASFNAREVTLRAALSEKYRREFPPLGPSRM